MARLFNRIENEPRSFTILCGDSGIGKTTVVEELERWLGATTFCARYECQRGDSADPLLKCLDNVLRRHVYAVENWLTLVERGLASARGRLKDPIRVANLFGSVLGVIGESQVQHAAFAKVTSKAFSVVREAFDPGITVPSSLIPRLAPEVFADVVEILRSAFPESKIVILLDNLSADSESLSRPAGQTSATDALVSFVGTAFKRTRGLHIVVTWKHIARTRASFEVLCEATRQYGAQTITLDPLSRDGLAEWLSSEFRWYREATEEDKLTAMEIAGGLPEVVVPWRERGVERLDFPLLTELARDVVESRYTPLTQELREPAAAEARPLLFQLAIMPHIPTEKALSQLTGQSPQQIRDFLEQWRRRGLLKYSDSHYAFAHEKKQEMVRNSLARDLIERGKEPAQALYKFLLENAGFANEVHPTAPAYIDFAWSISKCAQVSDAEIDLLQSARKFVREPAENAALAVPDLNLLPRFPWNARFLVFHRACAVDAIEYAELLESSVFDDSSEWRREPRQFTKGAFNALSSSGRFPTTALATRLLLKMEQLNADFPGDEVIAWDLVRTLVNLTDVYGKKLMFGELRMALGRLDSLSDRLPTGLSRPHALAMGLTNAIDTWGQNCQMSDFEMALDRITAIAIGVSSSDSAAAEIIAMGLANAARLWPTGLPAIVEHLRNLASRFPDNALVAECLGQTIFRSAGLADDRSVVALRPMIDELGRLSMRFPGDRTTAVNRARMLVNAMGIAGESMQLELCLSLYSELSNTVALFPNEDEMACAHSKGISNVAFAMATAGRYEGLKSHLASLKELHERFPSNQQIVADFSKSLYRTAIGGGPILLGESEWCLEELEDLAAQNSQNPDIISDLAYLYSAAVTRWVAAESTESALDMLQRLESLRQTYVNSAPVGAALAVSLVLFLRGPAAQRREVESELAGLVEQFGSTAEFRSAGAVFRQFGYLLPDSGCSPPMTGP